MNDSLLKISMSMHSNPGVYAILLGSGISRAAGIPTGWDVVIDLINRIAALSGENPEPDPEQWYTKKFGEKPDYSVLLEKLAATQAERNALLRSYFEPNEEEREQGLKVPTVAHKSIAKLVRDGFIKIILTTNFDRLMEMALQEEGIIPDFISSDDTLLGAMPYVHSKCTVVKLHGDYRDTRIKNTVTELEQYSEGMNSLLDRIFDEFGLIICGWSGTWDAALRNAIFRAPSRRFSTFWITRGKPSEEANQIIAHRWAELISVESADKFLTQLVEKVEALREIERPHPISTRMAVATVKKYLAEDKYRIRLHDLIHEEVEVVYRELSSNRFETRGGSINREIFQGRMHQYETILEKLMGMLSVICYFDKGKNTNLLTKSIERIIRIPRNEGLTAFINFQLYPALLIFYASAICALAAENYNALASVLLKPKYKDHYSPERLPAINTLNVYRVFSDNLRKFVPRDNAEREYTPVSNYLFDFLREPLRMYLPDEADYETKFSVFEYLLGLIYEDLISTEEGDVWAPVGRFRWRYNHDWGLSPVMEFMSSGIDKGEHWGLLKAGFFSGSLERLNIAINKYKEHLKKITWY